MPITQRTSAFILHSSHTGCELCCGSPGLGVRNSMRQFSSIYRMMLHYVPHLFIRCVAHEIPYELLKAGIKATGLFRFTHFECSHRRTPPPAKTYTNTYSIGHGIRKNDTLKHKYQQWVREATGQSLLQLCLFTEQAAATVVTQFKA